MSNALRNCDLNYCVARLPWQLREAVEEREISDAIIAGGFIRATIAREDVNDVDVFVPSEAVAQSLAADLVKRKLGSGTAGHVFETKNALTLTCFAPVIQIVHRWPFSGPAGVLNLFDFTVCRAAMWFGISREGDRWTSQIGDSFYADLAAKRLVYTWPSIAEAEPGGSMLRLMKYLRRGYHPPLDTIAAVTARCAAQAQYLCDTKARALEQDIIENLREIDPDVNERR
jgi:hypothetical protein